MINLRTSRFLLKLLLYMVWLVPLSSVQGQQSSMLLPDYADPYVVQEGDTLWEIAGYFLHDPARWQEIWQPDPYLDDPDMIYPGDALRINFVSGSPRIMVQRGDRDTENLSPQMRSQALGSSIPAIPLESIENSFTRNRIVTQALYDSAPYIIQNLGDNLAIATGDEVYARGQWPAGTTLFEVYRPSEEYLADDGETLLGLEVEYLGFASVTGSPADDLRRLVISNSSKEIQVGDRLLVREQSNIGATIYPSEPEQAVEGRIISLLDHEAMSSQLDTVVINLGLDDSLKIGDVLAVRDEDSSVIDDVERSRMGFRERMRAIFSGEPRLNLPGDDVGTLLVYRAFDQFSYAVILSSLRPIELNNRVTAP